MQGEKRESSFSGELYVGFAESLVTAINPDLEKLAELGYSVDDKEEPEYTKEKEGVQTARIDIYFKEVKTGHRFKKAFFLENEDLVQVPKDDWDQEKIDAFVPKTQWINQVGDTQWVVDEKDLPQRFTHFTKKNKDTKEVEVYGDKEYRIAKKGEGDLMAFVRKWLDFNYFQVSTNIFLDMKKIFNGNFKELQEQVGTEVATSTVELLGVRTVDKDGELNQYQSVYKTSMAGYLIKVLRNTKFTDTNIQKWKDEKFHKDSNPKGRYLKDYENFAIEVTGEWGFKDHFELVPFKLYDDSTDTTGSKEVHGQEKPKAASTSSDF